MCELSIAPTEPSPVTRLTTPGGNPASRASSTSRMLVSGVTSLGLITTVFPVASAGASFQDRIINGKFHGVISALTPTGSRRVYIKVSGYDTGLVVPWILVTQPA